MGAPGPQPALRSTGVPSGSAWSCRACVERERSKRCDETGKRGKGIARQTTRRRQRQSDMRDEVDDGDLEIERVGEVWPGRWLSEAGE